jgi:hypothetical protein
VGDPLGSSDPLPVLKSYDIIQKAKRPNISRAEIMHIKKKIEELMRKLEKITKSSPILDEHSKRGGQASEERASAPTGPTKVREEDSAGYRFDDTSLVFNTVGKR